jgi:hypothetical protein
MGLKKHEFGKKFTIFADSWKNHRRKEASKSQKAVLPGKRPGE